MNFDFATRYLNLPLIREPLNWAIIWVFASLWLLAFHSLMTGWTAMTSGAPASIGAGPGQIASPVPDVTTQFSMPGLMTGSLETFNGGITRVWTDSFESKYAEDGWTGNS